MKAKNDGASSRRDSHGPVEALERRRLYSVTVTEGYPGYYEVHGDDAANGIFITVSQTDRTFTLDGVTYPGVSYLHVYGRGGDDLIDVSGSPGPIAASVDGGAGSDRVSLNFDGAVWAGPGNDMLRLMDSFRGEVYGESGDDRIYVMGACVDPEIRGGPGNDLIDASRNHYGVTIFGDEGDDTIYGTLYADQIYGGVGLNALYGLGGNDTFYTANGQADRVDGGEGDGDVLYGDPDDWAVSNVEYVFRGY